jgi:molybdopterin molybdotransferase
VQDGETANNRFDLAGQINSTFDGIGPFWGNGLKRDIPHLPRKGRDRAHMPFEEKRAVEKRAKGAFSVWQLSGVGAVGSQVIMGLPVLARLRCQFAGRVVVWPFESLDSPVALVEIWPSLFNAAITPRLGDHPIKDAVQVHVVAEQIAAMPPAALANTLDVPATREGWIFGVTP